MRRIHDHLVTVERNGRDTYCGHKDRGRLETSNQFTGNQTWVADRELAGCRLERFLVIADGNSPICHIFMEISMNEKGIVNTQSSRSEPARLTMKMFLGERIFGFKIT